MVVAFDYSTAIAVHREAVLTAQAMANAGATAIVPSSDTTNPNAVIDEEGAEVRANDLYAKALQVGMLRQSSILPGTSPKIVPTQTSVAVEIPVSTEMRVASLFLSILSPGSPPVVVSSVGKAQTDLCVPQNAINVPECAYPTVDLRD